MFTKKKADMKRPTFHQRRHDVVEKSNPYDKTNVKDYFGSESG